VTAAQRLGGSITGLVAGSGVNPVAEEAAKVKGIEKIIMVENGSYDKACGPIVYIYKDIRTDNWLRVFQRITLPWWPRISRREGSHTSLLAIRLSARILCPELQRS